MDLEQAVRHQIDQIKSSAQFSSWIDQAKAFIAAGDFSVINNSFIFRDNIKTRKSALYLAERTTFTGLEPVVIHRIPEKSQNAEFVHVTDGTSDIAKVLPLATAIQEQLASLGTLVFLLIGHLGDTEPIEASMVAGPFRVLRLDPSLPTATEIIGQVVSTRDLSTPGDIWAAMQAAVPTLADKERASFTKAWEELLKDESAVLLLPPPGQLSDTPFLKLVANALDDETDNYEKSLNAFIADQREAQHYNNFLRIAYNFASEAPTIITLLISVCDLKPLIYWLTSADHFRLYSAFMALPWTYVNKKPSLAAYRDTIAGARNAAFHHLMPVSKGVTAKISDVRIQARSLHLFRIHGRRDHVALDYEDRELVEVLTQFTRALVRPVGLDFWQGNLKVMRDTAALVRSTAEALEAVHLHSK